MLAWFPALTVPEERHGTGKFTSKATAGYVGRMWKPLFIQRLVRGSCDIFICESNAEREPKQQGSLLDGNFAALCFEFLKIKSHIKQSWICGAALGPCIALDKRSDEG